MTKLQRLLLVAIVFCVAGINLLHKSYDDYILYFAAPASALLIYLTYQVATEKTLKQKTSNTQLFILLAALVFNAILGYILFIYR